MTRKMVRYALACQFQRRPIRRPDVGEKVLAGASRQFKEVFKNAQQQLRDIFAMEMVELPAKEKVTLAQRRAAQQLQSSKAPTAWVLVTVLPAEFRDPELIPPSAVPTEEEESKYVAIYTMLVSLITLSGGALPDSKLDNYFRRLGLDDATPVAGHEKTEILFKRLEKDGYIVKIKESTGAGEDDTYWMVGPRGKVEVGDSGIRGLVKTVFGDLSDAAEQELDKKLDRSLAMMDQTSSRQETRTQASTQRRRRSRRNVDDEGAVDEAEED
ncbi:MAGE-domain-containing protein [Piedraia hortae CBS 480.64]|uniref:MAGE-domain-containing protein n=1 Tax=Piedraia hortae CBS 480.64 TaxID=1314780 RepID=A0A6A7C137_9PEZI|nr:MAGE-domain-containing protein [Piedraia hortae CBS 480.64]